MSDIKRISLFVLSLIMSTVLSIGVVSSASANELAERVNAALAHPDRLEEDRARDSLRKPIEAMEFVGIEGGMMVIDVMAGAGWYSEVLAAAVGPDGTVYAHNTERGAARSALPLAQKAARHPNLKTITAETTGFGMDGQFDAAWTALNLHDASNRDWNAGIQYLQAVYDALKPGGVLGLIDHEGTEGNDNASLHRIPLSEVRELVTEVGFVIEAESDLLDNPEDDHTLNIRDESLRFNTDRILLRVRKPAE